eukprot:XP_001709248.1 Hypothetical protein GL50803_21160 [Giardia lamblia ATCC 50803]
MQDIVNSMNHAKKTSHGKTVERYAGLYVRRIGLVNKIVILGKDIMQNVHGHPIYLKFSWMHDNIQSRRRFIRTHRDTTNIIRDTPALIRDSIK